MGGVAHLRDRPGRRGHVRVDQGLDGVDHDERGGQLVHGRHHRADLRLRQQPQRRLHGPEPAGPVPDLRAALLARDVQHRHRCSGPCCGHLQQQRRLSDARLAADHRDGARHEASAEHPVQLRQASADRPGIGRHDLRDGTGGGHHRGAPVASRRRLLHEGVPRRARRAAARPLGMARAALRAPVPAHVRQPTQGVSRSTVTLEGRGDHWTSQPKSDACATPAPTRPGGSGGRTSASASGAPSGRTTASTATRGTTSPTTRRARAPTAGARTGWRASATTSSGCASPSRCGTSRTPS